MTVENWTQVTSLEGVDPATQGILQIDGDDGAMIQFVVPRKPCCALSPTLLTDWFGDDENDADGVKEVPVPNVSWNTFEAIAVWMKHFSDESIKPEEIKLLRKPLEEYLSPWTKAYVFGGELPADGNGGEAQAWAGLVSGTDVTQYDTPPQKLLDVHNAAAFLQLKDLLHLTCAAIANMVAFVQRLVRSRDERVDEKQGGVSVYRFIGRMFGIDRDPTEAELKSLRERYPFLKADKGFPTSSASPAAEAASPPDKE